MTTTARRAAVKRVPLDELLESGHPGNPKAHDIPTVMASIRRFGFADPVIRDERTGRIAAGHGRTLALAEIRDAGGDPPEGITGKWEVPVYVGWASKDDTEAEAALVALNRTTELGGWDDQALADLLGQLSEVEAGWDGVGYGQDDLDALRRRIDVAAAEGLDPYAEWEGAGMPEYDQPDLQSAYRATFHFSTEADADSFFEQIGRPKRRTVWWPENDGHVGCDLGDEFVEGTDGE